MPAALVRSAARLANLRLPKSSAKATGTPHRQAMASRQS